MPHIPPPISTRDAQKIEHRFWPKVKKGGEGECWPWVGSNSRGYGTIFAWGRPQYSHRFAYALGRGDVPLGGHVLHECDDPICCNPAHLFLGDQGTNMRDRNAKGRANTARGSQHACATIDEATAVAIYEADGLHKEIAERFGVTRFTVGAIKRGIRWRHATGGKPKRRYHSVRRALVSRATAA